MEDGSMGQPSATIAGRSERAAEDSSNRWVVSWGLGAVAFGGASLAVPLYIVRLGATPFQLGVLAATAAVIGAPGAILFGRLASRASNRRRLVLLTLMTATGTLALIPFVTDITTVIAVNALLWFVVASVGPVVTMLVVEASTEDVWSTKIGTLNTYYGYGWAGGLVVGMVWPFVGTELFTDPMASRILFWILSAVALFATVAGALTLPKPDTDRTVTDPKRARRISRLLARSERGVRAATFVFPANRLYWATRGFRPSRLWSRFKSAPPRWSRVDSATARYLLAVFFFFMGFAVFWAPLPHLLTGAGFDSSRIFALYFLSSLSGAVLFGGAGRLAKRFDQRRLLAFALSIRGLMFPVFAVSTGIGATILGSIVLGGLLLLIGITWAVIAVVGTTIVTRLAPPDLRSEALGSYVACGALAGGLGSVLGGWLATAGYLLAYGFAGGLVLLGGAIVNTIDIRS